MIYIKRNLKWNEINFIKWWNNFGGWWEFKLFVGNKSWKLKVKN